MDAVRHAPKLSAGVEASAEMRLGVHWSAADGWQKIQDIDYNTSYWLPSLTDGALNTSVRAMVSPEVIMIVWQTVPLEIKPKLLLVCQRGRTRYLLPSCLTASALLTSYLTLSSHLLSHPAAALTATCVRSASPPGLAPG